MAYKRLFSDEMIQLSASWVDPASTAHAAILATPDLAPMLPRLAVAHELLAKLTQPSPADTRLAAIVAEESVLDPRHDDVIRGGYGLLTSAAILLGEAGAELLALRDFLFPEGLSSTQASYRAEAGQAAQLATRLTPALRAQLAGIVVGPKKGNSTLEDFIDELILIGARIGVLEDEKGRLQPAPGDQGPSLAGAILAARNQWVRVVNALTANGEMAELPAATDKLVFGPLRAAETAADRRAASAVVKKKPAEAEATAKAEAAPKE